MNQQIKSTLFFIFVMAILGINFCLNGCSKAVIAPKPVEQSIQQQVSKPVEKILKPEHSGVQPYEQQEFNESIDYFGQVPTYPLHKLNSESYYPDFARDIYGKEGLKRALKQSIIYYGRVPKSTKFYFGDDKYDASFMLQSAKKFLNFLEKAPSSKDIQSFINKYYNVYTTVRRLDSKSSLVNSHVVNSQTITKHHAIKNSNPANNKKITSGSQHSEIDLSVLFTGYYEPLLQGSLVKGGEYIYPIYSRPNDLIEVPRGGFSGKYKGTPASGARRNAKKELVPYYTRAEIDSMKDFEKHAKPLAWVNSRIDRFFLEIQGSGIIELKQGGTMKVQYSAKNGRPYRSIGKYLVDKGEMAKEDVTMQSLRKWLNDNPSRVDEVLNHNLSFVFFKKGQGGAVGCLGVEVTRMRTIATDKALFPRGALCFIDTTIPAWNSKENDIAWQKYAAFVLNQDTGGAIKGSGRADYFFGHGNYAELAAGNMKQYGRLYFLIHKK